MGATSRSPALPPGRRRGERGAPPMQTDRLRFRPAAANATPRGRSTTARPGRRRTAGPVVGVIQHTQRGQRDQRQHDRRRGTGGGEADAVEQPGQHRRDRDAGQRARVRPDRARTAASARPRAGQHQHGVQRSRRSPGGSAGSSAVPTTSCDGGLVDRRRRPCPSWNWVRNRPTEPRSATGRRRSSTAKPISTTSAGERRPRPAARR